MKKRESTNLRMVVVLLAAAVLVLAMPVTHAGAQDVDLDGFTDQEETDGITLPDNVTFWPGSNSGLPREQRLDPTTPDLFVILVPATPSNFPANPLEFVPRPEAEGGLGITCHVISPEQAPVRSITPDQNAVKVTESLDATGEELGVANYGTPNDLDYVTVYTERIRNHVNSVCASASQCKDSATGFTGTDLINLYINHTIAHEIGHVVALAVEYNSRFGGHHYRTGSKVVMEQSVKYTDKGGKVTFYISTDYATPSQEGYVIH